MTDEHTHLRHVDGHTGKILLRNPETGQYVIEHESGFWEMIKDWDEEWAPFTPMTPPPAELWFGATPDQGFTVPPNAYDAFSAGPFMRSEVARTAEIHHRAIPGWHRYVLAESIEGQPTPVDAATT